MAGTSHSSNCQQPIYPTRDDQIEPEQAKFLYEQHCAFLVVENLPVGSEFGIDMASFTVGDKFKGVKLIPPGLHFVFANAIDKDGKQLGPRCGFYHVFQTKELLLKRWSTTEEDFDDSFEPTVEMCDRYLLNLKDLDRYLGAYRFSSYKTFLSLTDKLTPDLVQELVPVNNKIRSVTYLTRNANRSRQTRPKRRTLKTDDLEPSEKNLLPDLQPDKESVIRFTQIPDSRAHELDCQMTPEMVTQYNLDTTMKLKEVFGFDDRAQRRLLGEFQFAFITLILGHVYDCFEHWRDILVLICSSDSAIVEHPDLFLDFAKIMQRQLEQVSEDIFQDISQIDNLIRHHLDMFVQNIEQTPLIDDTLRDEVRNLRNLAEEKFGWIFELEPDDEQPVVI